MAGYLAVGSRQPAWMNRLTLGSYRRGRIFEIISPNPIVSSWRTELVMLADKVVFNAIFLLRKLLSRNNDFIDRHFFQTRWFVLDFFAPLNIGAPHCEETMRSLGLFCTLMTDVRPIIGSIGWRHLPACIYRQTEEPVAGFAGME
jgi:hypothetical protein